MDPATRARREEGPTGGEASAGEASAGEASSGEVPWGEVSWGEVTGTGYGSLRSRRPVRFATHLTRVR